MSIKHFSLIFTAGTVGYSAWKYSEELKYFYDRFILAEPKITKAAKIINQLSDDKTLDKITQTWIDMEAAGGFKAFLVQNAKDHVYFCASENHINLKRATELSECMHQASLNKGNALAKVTSFYTCFDLHDQQPEKVIDNAMHFANCLTEFSGQDSSQTSDN